MMASPPMRDAARAFALATDFVLSVVIFAGLGYLADQWQDTGARYLLIGLGLGLVIGAYRFVKEALRMAKPTSRPTAPPAHGPTDEKDQA